MDFVKFLEDLVVTYFSGRQCSNCRCYFDRSSIELISHDAKESSAVAKITCTKCDTMLGDAVIKLGRSGKEVGFKSELKPKSFLSVKDQKKFNKLGPITPDEQIELHKKLENLPTGIK